jgi:FkbM family methyltransferase
MTRKAIEILGGAARLARAAHLGRPLGIARDSFDSVLVRTGRPPLGAATDGFVLRGFLRHRSYLAHVAEGTPGGYRRLLAQSVEPGATVCDGGAHVGLYTVIASRLAGPDGLVLAFEPDRYNLHALSWNVAHLGAGNVVVVEKALAAAPGVAEFHENSGTISSSLATRPGVGTESTRRVEVTSLDAELAGRELGRLVVKLNIEGAEPLALAGMAQSLERAASVRLFVELNPRALEAADADPAELVGLLRGHGLDVSWIDPIDESLSPLDDGAPFRKGHLFCARG